MTMRNVSWFIGLAALAGLAGCGATDDGAGSLDLALTAQTASGTIYRLRDATISVDGPAAQLTLHTEDDPTRTVISAPTPAGHYALTLRDGWRLEKIGADGMAVNVNARLTSANPQTFDVASGAATQVRLRFSVDGHQVQTGDGEVDVGIDVDEEADAGPIDAPIDAPPPIDAPIDAPPPIDAPIDGPLGDPCAVVPTCPAPAAGKTSLCGQIYDIEDTTPIALFAGAQVQVAAYDSLAFINNPSTPPLVTGVPDSCGRFVLPGVPVPSTGFISLAVVGMTTTDRLVPTSIVVSGLPGARMADLRLYATRASTESAWSVSAGTPVAQRGAYLAIYLDGNREAVGPYAGAPRPFVSLMEDGMTDAPNDFYFTDFSPLSRHQLFAPLMNTGGNGSALLLGGALVEYSGAAAGCTVPSHLGATAPGVIVVQEFLASCQ